VEALSDLRHAIGARNNTPLMWRQQYSPSRGGSPSGLRRGIGTSNNTPPHVEATVLPLT